MNIAGCYPKFSNPFQLPLQFKDSFKTTFRDDFYSIYCQYNMQSWTWKTCPHIYVSWGSVTWLYLQVPILFPLLRHAWFTMGLLYFPVTVSERLICLKTILQLHFFPPLKCADLVASQKVNNWFQRVYIFLYNSHCKIWSKREFINPIGAKRSLATCWNNRPLDKTSWFYVIYSFFWQLVVKGAPPWKEKSLAFSNPL